MAATDPMTVRGEGAPIDEEQSIWPFLRFAGAGAGAAILAALLGPCLISPWLGAPGEASIAARVALGFAGLMGLLTGFALYELVRVPGQGSPVLVKVPAQLTPWLTGLVPILVGILIGMAFFK
jgi:hypothetical protein